MKYPIVSHNPEIQQAYVRARKKGESHSMAEIIAFRQPSGTKGTDRAFMEGRMNDQQFSDDPNYGKWIRLQARRAGVNPTGKYYSAALAEYPGDPRAWVDSVGEVKKIAEERGYGVSGAVNVKPRVAEVERKPDVAPDLVWQHTANRVAQGEKDSPELREQVKEAICPVR